MDKNLKEKILVCVNISKSKIEYNAYLDLIKSFVETFIEKIEYYEDESSSNGKIAEFNLIDISNQEVIQEVIINKRKLEDKVNDMLSIEDNIERRLENQETVFEIVLDCLYIIEQYKYTENTGKNKIIDNLFVKMYCIEAALNIFKDIDTHLNFENISEEFLNEATKEEVKVYKNNVDKMYDRFRDEEETFQDMYERLNIAMDRKISYINNSRRGMESKAISVLLDIKDFIEYVKQDYTLNLIYGGKNIDIGAISKRLELVECEVARIENITRKDDDVDIESISSKKVKTIIENKKNDIEEIESIDPEKYIQDFLTDNYPEVLKNITEFMDSIQFYEKIDNLPENVEKSLKSLLMSQYTSFIRELKTTGQKIQKKLEVKLENYDEKYGIELYKAYMKMSDEEKDELLISLDEDGFLNLKDIIVYQRDILKAGLTQDIGYLNLCEYICLKNISLEKDNVKVKEDIKLNLKDNEVLNKYFEAIDCIKALNEISSLEIEDMYMNNPAGIRDVICTASKDVEDKYLKYILNAGRYVVYKSTKEEFQSYLSISNNKNIKLKMLEVGLYAIQKDKESIMSAVTSLYKSGMDTNDYVNIVNYITLWYKALELNLREKAANNNLKLNIPNEFSLVYFIEKIDKYNIKMINSYKYKKMLQDRQIMYAQSRKNALHDKIQWAKDKLGGTV